MVKSSSFTKHSACKTVVPKPILHKTACGAASHLKTCILILDQLCIFTNYPPLLGQHLINPGNKICNACYRLSTIKTPILPVILSGSEFVTSIFLCLLLIALSNLRCDNYPKQRWRHLNNTYTLIFILSSCNGINSVDFPMAK